MNVQSGYATNFGAGIGGGGTRGVEGQVIASTFKYVVTRFVKANKEIKLQENMVIFKKLLSIFLF